MNLAQLRALTAIAEAGSVTGGAAALGLTQSAVSHALTSLETELGLRLVLLDRTGSVLTDLGARLLPHATETLRHINLLADEAAGLAGIQQGRLRIGVMPSACQLLPPLLSPFTRQHPAVQVVLLEGSDLEVSAWIDQRTVELGVVTGPRPELDTVPLAHDEMLAVLPTQHPLAGQAEMCLAELADDPFLLSTGGCEPLIRQLYEQQGLPLTPAHRIRDMTTLLAMVREELGVSVVPQLALARSLAGITALPLRPRAPRELLLATRAARDLSPAGRAFTASLPQPEAALALQ